MKLLLLALVALAAAEPESDSLYYTNNWGVNSWYPNTAYAANTWASPLVNTYASGLYSGVYGNAYNSYVPIVKRDADPAHHLVYNNWFGVQPSYVYRQPHVAQVQVAGEPVFKKGTFYTNLRNVDKVAAAGGVGQVYQNLYNYQTLVKRDADSDSDSLMYAQYPGVTYQAGVHYPLSTYSSNVYGNVFPNVYGSFYPRTVLGSTYVKRDAESDSLYYSNVAGVPLRTTAGWPIAASTYGLRTAGWPYTTTYASNLYNQWYL